MTAKEITELMVISAIDPVLVLRGTLDVEDDEPGTDGVAEAVEVIGVVGVPLVKVGKV